MTSGNPQRKIGGLGILTESPAPNCGAAIDPDLLESEPSPKRSAR
jgi:hypothetical protein